MGGGVEEEGEGVARTVRAAGGLVWRMANGGVEVLLVHRPSPELEDWSFPKGKVDLGDPDDEHAALREVLEETGLRCSLGRELPSISYVDRKGRDKTVRYWEMRVLDGEFAPNVEVDEIRWLGLEEAGRTLSYERDGDVLDAFAVFAGQVQRNVG